MPWHIKKTGKKYAVILDKTGESVGESDTMAKAKAHLAALNANVKTKSMKTLNSIIKAQDASEISLEDLKQQCSTLASNDDRFNKRSDGTSVNGQSCYCYCPSLTMKTDDGGVPSFKVVICAANSKYYEVPITIADGVVTSLDSGEVEVKQKTMWVTAKAKKGICLNDVMYAGGPGSGPQSRGSVEHVDDRAAKATKDADDSGTAKDHAKASNAHVASAKMHEAAAKISKSKGDKEGENDHLHQANVHYGKALAHDDKSESAKASSKSSIYASGTPDGASAGHATKKTDAANEASVEAHGQSAIAHESGEDNDHGTAKVAHEVAIEKHKAALLAQSKAGNEDLVNYHIDMIAAHQACANAHDCGDEDKVEASMKSLGNFIKAEDAKKDQYTTAAHDARDKSRAATQATELANDTGKPDDHQDAEDKHGEAKEAHKKAEKIARSKGDDQAARFHSMKANQHATSMFDNAQYSHASDADEKNVIHCRANGSQLTTGWEVGKPVTFMYMPEGIHTITAGFRKADTITITVEVDEDTAPTIQASYENMRKKLPKQEPFGCIEHREAEASVRACDETEFVYGEYKDTKGVLLTASPTKLGVENVNGGVHRSWSPSFATDAAYDEAEEEGGVYSFPEGVRGSTSNPARITGIDFCFGTLTNKPAFSDMPAVKARQGGNGQGRLDGILAKLGKPSRLDAILAKVGKEQIGARPAPKKSLGDIFARLGKTGNPQPEQK